MNNADGLFPKFAKSIENLIEDEEGSIPGNKLLLLGTMVIVLGNLLAIDAYAAHRSHSSHKSHSSHSSHSLGSHGSHGNHGSHESHVSHQSHTSHSNTASHSNSLYSAEGDVTYPAPAVSKIPGVTVSPVKPAEGTFVLPEVNQNIETPNSTPIPDILPSFAMPAVTPATKIEADTINDPAITEKIK